MNFLEEIRFCKVLVNFEYSSTIVFRINNKDKQISIKTRWSESHSDLFISVLKDEIQLIRSSICPLKVSLMKIMRYQKYLGFLLIVFKTKPGFDGNVIF